MQTNARVVGSDAVLDCDLLDRPTVENRTPKEATVVGSKAPNGSQSAWTDVALIGLQVQMRFEIGLPAAAPAKLPCACRKRAAQNGLKPRTKAGLSCLLTQALERADARVLVGVFRILGRKHPLQPGERPEALRTYLVGELLGLLVPRQR